MDPMVLEVQQWVNINYSNVPGYIPAPETGRTGWSTMYALTMALQHELGISPVTPSFGPATKAAYKAWGEMSMGSVPETQKGYRIVMILQGGCWCKGYNPGGFTGTFGAGTKAAITKLQSDANLPVKDGKVYDYIFDALLSMDAYVLTPGGDSRIREMQRDLNFHYFTTSGVQPTDGHYQRGTNKAMIYGIQTEQGIPASQQTGSVGPTTRDKLPTLSYGSTGVFVKFLQYALYVNNFDPGAFDGSFGLGVQNTVKKFQSFVGLTADGYAGKQTWLSALISTGDPNRKGTACDCVTEITPARAQTLLNAGYKTVGRYLSNVKNSTLNKKIQPGEIDVILSSGLTIFPIYQLVGLDTSYFTYTQGRAAAFDAYEAAIKYGFKQGTTIYFAVDYDAQDGEITSSIIPYFEGVQSALTELGSFYRAGVYGARNVCIRVSENGLADTSFVSGMSTGFSGNLGYPLPSNWAFDQISTISIGSRDGFITIDNNIKSGRYNGESSVEPLQQGLNDGFFRQLNQIYQAAVEYKDQYVVDESANELVAGYYRQTRYVGPDWYIIAGPFNKEFEAYVDGKYGDRSIVWPIDPKTMEPIDIQHLMATLSALRYHGIQVGAAFQDFSGWAGDLYTVVNDVYRTRDNERYTGTLLERTYQSAYEHIGTNTMQSFFDLADVLSDIDAVNIARKMEADIFGSIVSIFEEYYTQGYRTRFNGFYFAEYASNEQNLRQAAEDVMVDKFKEAPTLDIGRHLLEISPGVPDFTKEEGKAIAKAYSDKILYYVRNEVDM